MCLRLLSSRPVSSDRRSDARNAAASPRVATRRSYFRKSRNEINFVAAKLVMERDKSEWNVTSPTSSHAHAHIFSWISLSEWLVAKVAVAVSHTSSTPASFRLSGTCKRKRLLPAKKRDVQKMAIAASSRSRFSRSLQFSAIPIYKYRPNLSGWLPRSVHPHSCFHLATDAEPGAPKLAWTIPKYRISLAAGNSSRCPRVILDRIRSCSILYCRRRRRHRRRPSSSITANPVLPLLSLLN